MTSSTELPRRHDAIVAGAGFGVAIYAFVLVIGNRLLNDPDTYLHIATGRWIWTHRAVPFTDPFSYSKQGAPWTAHEWLAEAILAAAHRAFGWSGLVALAAAAIATSTGILVWAMGRYVRIKVALAIGGFAFLLAGSHMTARPHVLALPIVVLFSVLLVFARSENRAPSLAALPLVTIWANLHGSFILGPALAAAFAFEALVVAADAPERRKALRAWAPFVVGAFLASLLVPHGIHGWLFPFKLTSNRFAIDFVTEWRSSDFSTLGPLEIWLLALVALGFAVGLRVRPYRLLLLAGVIHMALGHRRHAELLAFLGPLLLAESIRQALPNSCEDLPRLRGRTLAGLAAAFGLLTAIAALRGYHENPRIAPAAALAAAKQANLDGKLFNDYDFGGYLIFSGIAPYVDGRIDFYQDAYMQEYAAALDARGEALPELLDRIHADWTLLQPDTPAVTALNHSPGWKLVYADPFAVVHARR